MAGIYWFVLIPLFFLAVVIAVLPVLYGTLRHDHWERREAKLKERQQTEVVAVDPVEYPIARAAHIHTALEDARSEAQALLTRIEVLERVGRSA
jgi:membrane protein required for beta-lactamase induction